MKIEQFRIAALGVSFAIALSGVACTQARQPATATMLAAVATSDPGAQVTAGNTTVPAASSVFADRVDAAEAAVPSF